MMWWVYLVAIAYAAFWFTAGRVTKKQKAAPPQEEKWEYLGQRTFTYHGSGAMNGQDAIWFHVHFWAQGPLLDRRKVTWNGAAVFGYRDSINKEQLENHRDYSARVPRWINGSLVSGPIELPSPHLIEWMKKHQNKTWNWDTKEWEDDGSPKPLPEKPSDDVIDAIMNTTGVRHGDSKESPTGGHQEGDQAGGGKAEGGPPPGS